MSPEPPCVDVAGVGAPDASPRHILDLDSSSSSSSSCSTRTCSQSCSASFSVHSGASPHHSHPSLHQHHDRHHHHHHGCVDLEDNVDDDLRGHQRRHGRLRSPSLSPFPHDAECRDGHHHHLHPHDDIDDEDLHHVVDVIEDLTRACLEEGDGPPSPRHRRNHRPHHHRQRRSDGVAPDGAAALLPGSPPTADLPLIEFSSSSEHLPAVPVSLSGDMIPCECVPPDVATGRNSEDEAALPDDAASQSATAMATAREHPVTRQDSKVVLVTKV